MACEAATEVLLASRHVIKTGFFNWIPYAGELSFPSSSVFIPALLERMEIFRFTYFLMGCTDFYRMCRKSQGG